MKYADTMNVCLGKGLLAPLGSIIVGSKKFMKSFKANRKMMGGILRKPGVVAGAALIALKKTRLDSWKVNEMARKLA
jgi:threonine aldolase